MLIFVFRYILIFFFESLIVTMMDTSKMKVTELRAELKKRGLETGGVKAESTTRLTEALENAEDSDGESADTARPSETKKRRRKRRRSHRNARKVKASRWPLQTRLLHCYFFRVLSPPLNCSFLSAPLQFRHLVGAKRF